MEKNTLAVVRNQASKILPLKSIEIVEATYKDLHSSFHTQEKCFADPKSCFTEPMRSLVVSFSFLSSAYPPASQQARASKAQNRLSGQKKEHQNLHVGYIAVGPKPGTSLKDKSN